MNKTTIIRITFLVMVVLASCGSSPQATLTPTETTTPTPEPTATATDIPMPTATLTPVPTATLTPEPEVGDIPGISRTWFVNGVLVGILRLDCDNEETFSHCKTLQFDTSSCSSIDVTVIGKSNDTIDKVNIFVSALTTDESHNDCQNILGLLASIPYLEATPEIAQSWVLENIKDHGPDSENSIEIEKTFAGVDFKLTANSGVYFLFIK